MRDEDKQAVYITAVMAIAVVLVTATICLACFAIDREAYRNGYVPVQNESRVGTHLEKPEGK